jgi:hypothetical protein
MSAEAVSAGEKGSGFFFYLQQRSGSARSSASIASAIVASSVLLCGTPLALLQGLIFLLVPPFISLLTFARILVCLGTLFVVGFGLTGLGFFVVSPMQSTRPLTPL